MRDMDLENGVVLDTGCGYMQILKRISDGYLVLDYEPAHYVYNVLFRTFDEIKEYKVVEDDWVKQELFEDSCIVHIDEFGFCKKVK